MKRIGRREIFAAIALFAVVFSTEVVGQSRSEAQGTLFNRDVVTIADLAGFAQTSSTYGTARSMALGGAISALGADASSMAVNPAGIAFARANEYSFTPAITFGDSRTAVGVNNISAIFVLDQSAKSSFVKGSLMNLNIALGYNKVADHNYNYGFRNSVATSSVAHLFSEQLNNNKIDGKDITLEDLNGVGFPNWNTFPTRLWGAALGYKGGMTDDIGTETDPDWSATWLSSSAVANQTMYVNSRGSTGDFNATMSGNINNKLYFGAGVSLMTIEQDIDILYSESYSNNDLDDSNVLLRSDFNQAIVLSGAGINAKFGVTYRPIQPLRIAVAYHTPTLYTLNRLYQASVATIFDLAGDRSIIVADSPILEDRDDNSWNFRTQSRLLAGVAYTFGERALLSFDYQCDWYGQVAMRGAPAGVSSTLYSCIDDVYQSVNTFRFGGEFRVTPQLSLRGGYGFSTALLRNSSSANCATESDLLGIAVVNKTQYYSAGIGYSVSSKIAFDVAYMNVTRDLSDYTSLYGTATNAQSGIYSASPNTSTVALSMSVKM